MNPTPPDTGSSPAPRAPFDFFPPGMTHTPGEGRDPRVPLEMDFVSRNFPTANQIAAVLFLVSLVLFLASMSWTAFPGPPTLALLAHLDPRGAPTTLDPLWGWVLRGCARLPMGTIAGWAGLFSALCGAACVALLAKLMMRVGYLIRNEPGRYSFVREAQARRLSGVVAGLYLACSIPFWVASTRSLPDTFHVLLLLAFAWFVSQYQHWGRRRHLFLAGFLFGLGASEFPTFLVFSPLAIFVVVREMFRWRSLRTWQGHAALFGGLALGLLFYPLDAFVFYKQSLAAGAYVAPLAAVQQLLAVQVQQITQIRFSPGFLVIVAVSALPWLTLFAMSSRSPWFYEWGQVGMRLVFLGGFCAILFDASFSPWNLTGMGYLMITPYLMLAICAGYVAGEFLILGERQAMLDASPLRKGIRRASTWFALSIPVVVLAGGACNWRVVDGRYGRITARAVSEVLGRLHGRDILISTGLLDESLCYAVLEDQRPELIISAPQVASELYLKRLARAFAQPTLREPLLQNAFGLFVENLLMAEDGLERVGIIDLPDMLNEFGYLVPDGFHYRLELSSDRIDLPAVVAAQKPFWDWMEQMAEHPAPERNVIRPYQDLLRQTASKVANNLGVLQMRSGDDAGAVETWRNARRMYPDNLSVLMNLVEWSSTSETPDAAEWLADWEDRQTELSGERWVLALRFGYVWNAREWVKRGCVWALSGVAATEEAARRKPAVSDEDEATNDNRAQVLDQAYLLWGGLILDDGYYRGRLLKDERNTGALLALCRLALRHNDPDAAEAYVAEAMAMGLAEEQTLFDRAMVAYVRGDKAAALKSLTDLSRQTPGDLRVWMAILLLAAEDDPLSVEALKMLKSQGAAPIGVHLALASVHMARQQWAAAQAELDKAIQMEPRNVQAWEMMVVLAQERGNKPLLDAGMRALLDRNPDHFLQYQNAGVEAYRKGDLAKAEASFRQGLQRQRNAVLLNNLAHVITEQDGNLQDALKLINEALLRQPGQASMLSTRGAIYVKLGRFEEARQDLQESLRKQGRTGTLLLLLAQTYEGLGDRTRSLTAAKALAVELDKLEPKQRVKAKEVIRRLEAAPPPADVAPAESPRGADGELARIEAELRRQPGDPALLGARGARLVELGRYAEARQDLSASLRKLGRNDDRLLQLARACEGLGDIAGAAKIADALAAQPERLTAVQKRQLAELRQRLR